MGIFAQSDKTKFKKIKEEECYVSFSIELPEVLLKEETDNQLVRIQQGARIPGFRQGKAPMDVVRRQYEAQAREKVFDNLLRKSLPDALTELDIKPVAVPVVEDMKHEPGKPLSFKVKAEVAPKVTPKDYLKIKVERRNHQPTERDLELRLKELQEGNARLEISKDEAVGSANYVLVDFEAQRDGKSLPGGKHKDELVDMSSDQTIEGLTEGLLGMKRGETKDVPVKIEKKDAKLSVTVKEIKTKLLPALDAEFAKDMGFQSLDELKTKLKEVMGKEGTVRTDREVARQIEEALLKANRIPVPASLVEAQVQNNLERLRKQHLGPNGRFGDRQLEELKDKIRPQAEDEIRIAYLLASIADREKVQALDSDIESEMNKSVDGASSDEQKNDIRKLFSEKRGDIMKMLQDRKTMQYLREKAVITDVPAGG